MCQGRISYLYNVNVLSFNQYNAISGIVFYFPRRATFKPCFIIQCCFWVHAVQKLIIYQQSSIYVNVKINSTLIALSYEETELASRICKCNILGGVLRQIICKRYYATNNNSNKTTSIFLCPRLRPLFHSIVCCEIRECI